MGTVYAWYLFMASCQYMYKSKISIYKCVLFSNFNNNLLREYYNTVTPQLLFVTLNCTYNLHPVTGFNLSSSDRNATARAAKGHTIRRNNTTSIRRIGATVTDMMATCMGKYKI